MSTIARSIGVFLHHRERFRAAFRLRAHFQIRLLIQHLDYAFAKKRVIIHHDDGPPAILCRNPLHRLSGNLQVIAVPPRLRFSILSSPRSAFAR